MNIAKKGDVVRVHYKGTLTSGEIFDSSAGREPLEFILDSGQMIAGFDAGVLGMAVGDKKELQIPAEDAYGEWSEENTIPFPKDNFPADLELEVGMELTMRNEQGHPFNVIVSDIQDDMVILDANHPLAGKDLIFNLELVELNPGQSRIIMP